MTRYLSNGKSSTANVKVMAQGFQAKLPLPADLDKRSRALHK